MSGHGKIVLVPGIWMPARSLGWLARHLRAAGFDCHQQGYRSLRDAPEETVQRLLPALRAADIVVAHSLGGLMSLKTLQQHPDLPVRQLICLGSPLCGSAVAARLQAGPLRGVLGASAALLGQGMAGMAPQSLRVAMIAGTRNRGAGRFLAALPQPSDGTVSVSETRWPGLSDHVLVDASHSGLLYSSEVLQRLLEFLRQGRFSRSETSADASP